MSKSDNTKQYTILQVVPSLVAGGVERGTIEVAKHLKNSGHIPIIISKGGPLIAELIKSGIVHINMNSASKNPFTIWKNAKLISEVIKKYNVDLVHARSRAPAWSCYMAAKSTNTKFLTTFHGIYNISNYFKKYYNSIMIKGEKVIAVSEFVKTHLLKNYNILEDEIVVIHRGVDHHHFNPDNNSEIKLAKTKEKYDIPKDTPVLLLPSRMSNWKGHITLVQALGKLKNRNFYCLMVGDLSKHPNYTSRVKDLICSLKLQSKVQIFGNEMDVLSLYGISDVVLSTSIEPEAFGRTIIEGQAMEKLVIATNIGGAIETVINNQTGYHVKPNNADDLAEKIDYCLSILGTDEATKIQKAARKTVIDNFSIDLMLSKTLELYERLLQ